MTRRRRVEATTCGQTAEHDLRHRQGERQTRFLHTLSVAELERLEYWAASPAGLGRHGRSSNEVVVEHPALRVGRLDLQQKASLQDVTVAMRWYRLADEQGYAEAQATLGRRYVLRCGLESDDVQVPMWLNRAASRLTGEERESTINIRDLFAADMTPDDLAEAKRLAREWDAAHPG